MKRIISLTLLIVMLLSASAIAEDFTLHSGVRFGMSTTEVESAEKSNGFLPKSSDGETSVTGSIAGIKEAAIEYYYFENKLFLANYDLGYTYKKETDEINQLQSDYEMISDSLQMKYGSTEYNWLSNKKYNLPDRYHDKCTSAFGKQEWYIEWYKKIGSDDPGVLIDKYEQWLVMFDDGSGVLIDHCLWWLNNSQYNHDIFYTHFDKDIIQIDNDQQQQRMDDL